MFKLLMILALATSALSSIDIKIVNNSPDTPVLVKVQGLPDPSESFTLNGSEEKSVSLDDTWSGRIWGRTDCSTAEECDKNKIPSSLVEISAGFNGETFYDIALIDGYNINVSAVPENANGVSVGECAKAACSGAILENCPADNQITNDEGVVISCKNADFFRDYCPDAFITEEDLANTFYCNSNKFVVTLQ